MRRMLPFLAGVVAAAAAAAPLLAPVGAGAQTAGGTVRAAGSQGWTVSQGTCTQAAGGSVAFVTGPATPPQGSGSVEIQATPGSQTLLRGDALAGLRLADIISLRYTTFAWTGFDVTAVPSLMLEVDNSASGLPDDVLVFSPQYQYGFTTNVPSQGPFVPSQWQTWEAGTGGWYSRTGAGGANVRSGVKTLAQYAAYSPQARIAAKNGLSIGFVCLPEVTGPEQARTGYADALSVATATLGTRTWDFEAAAAVTPAGTQTAAAGTVLQLSGTPHLWVADDQGVLHWGGDTRALAGRSVLWGTLRQVSLDDLRAYRMGDPWLSAGLLKLGTPIYLVKWEANEAQPRLLHIQSLDDVSLFGITAANYGTFVLERAAWESRFPFNTDALERQELASAVGGAPAAVATPTVAPVPLGVRAVSVTKIAEPSTYQTTLEVTGAQAGQRLQVQLAYEEWVCAPSCTSTNKGTWGPLDAGPADASGKLTFRDNHGPYKAYTYTFSAAGGRSGSVTLGDDLTR